MFDLVGEEGGISHMSSRTALMFDLIVGEEGGISHMSSRTALMFDLVVG